MESGAIALCSYSIQYDTRPVHLIIKHLQNIMSRMLKGTQYDCHSPFNEPLLHKRAYYHQQIQRVTKF